MVFTGPGLSYSDLRGMDLGEFREAVEAKILFNTEWKPAKGGGARLRACPPLFVHKEVTP